MHFNYQIVFFIAAGIFLFFIYLRKKGINSAIINALNYLGLGLLFYGIAITNDLYSFIGVVVMLFSIIAVFIIEKS